MTHAFRETAPLPEFGPPVSTLVLFGRTRDRIASMARLLARWMAADGAAVPLSDVAHTLNHHRAWHRLFATVCARDRAQAIAGLTALAQGRPAPGVVEPHEGPCRIGTVFVYPGEGSEWTGMGRQLLADEPEFAMAVAELDAVFVQQLGFSLRRALTAGEPVVGTERAQPVLMGLQLALTELWRVHGTLPQAVIGLSTGEVTAAVVAGALSVAEGLRVIAIRSRFAARLAEQDVTAHTEQTDALVAELRSALGDVARRKPVVPLISTVTDPRTAPVLDAEYWVENLRRPARFREAVTVGVRDNATFVEISPDARLTQTVNEVLGGTHHHSVGTLCRHGDDTVSFHTNVNATHTIYPPETPHPAEPHPVVPTAPMRHIPLSVTSVGARRSGAYSRREAGAARSARPLGAMTFRRY
jgi:acyl transferase domain-containing protein